MCHDKVFILLLLLHLQYSTCTYMNKSVLKWPSHVSTLSFLSPSFVYDLYFSFSLHSSFSVLELIAGWTAEQGCLCFSHHTLDAGSVYV